MIRAYPAEPTVAAGGDLLLHVATDAPRFRFRVVRRGREDRPLYESPQPLPGHDAPPGRVDEPWAWPAYALAVPAAWPPGAYVVQCIEDGAQAPALDARAGTALVVVRGPSFGPLVVNLPLFTYHAYNVAEADPRVDEGACLYSGPTAVTLGRPGGGTGGHLWDERHADVYARSSPRQTFAHWDGPAIRWLEAQGYAPRVCTDLDLHRGEGFGDVRLLLAFGHWEYWTVPMRAAVEALLERGGNVAVFSGCTAWFRVRFDGARQAIVRDGKWCDDRPEEQLLGTSYRFGAGRWGGPRPPSGFAVHDPEHWAFAGTGCEAGTTFGAEARLLGYECDGPAPGTELLASGSVGSWGTDERGEVLGGNAAMVLRRCGAGLLFNAATTDWSRLLAAGDPIVARVTANVVERLSARPSSAQQQHERRAAGDQRGADEGGDDAAAVAHGAAE